MRHGVGRILLGADELATPIDAPRRSAFIVSRDEILTAYHCLFREGQPRSLSQASDGTGPRPSGAGRSDDSAETVTRGAVNGTADQVEPPWWTGGIWFRLPGVAEDGAGLDVPVVVAWTDDQLDVALLRIDAAALSPTELRARRSLLKRRALRPRRSATLLADVVVHGFSSSNPGESGDTWVGRVTELDGRASNGAPAINVHVEEGTAPEPPAVPGFSGGPVVLGRGRGLRSHGQAIAIVREFLSVGDRPVGGDLYATALRDIAARSPRLHTLVRRETLRRRSPFLAVVVAVAVATALVVVLVSSRPAVSLIRHPSDRPGGDLRLVVSAQEDRLHLDSLDPAINDSPSGVNLERVLNRTLVTFQSRPGMAGLDLVGDLAETVGRPSDNARTWTYHLRAGITFNDGLPVRADDVRYALERSFASGTLLGGRRLPGADVLDLRSLLDASGTYAGPFGPNHPRLSSISTPDDRTIVFHLTRSCADWSRYMALPMSAPVPRAYDDGATYGLNPASTGPYQVQTLMPGRNAVLVRNPSWRQRADPVRRALPDRITIKVLPTQDQVDQALVNGDADVDLGHSGALEDIQSAATTPDLTSRSALVPDGLSYFLALATTVAPLNDINCRYAIFYGADRANLLKALGGASQVRAIGSVAIPEVLTGKESDYLAGRYPHGEGRVEQALRLCGHPDGFSVTIPVRDAQPQQLGSNNAQRVADALRDSLRPFGIVIQTQDVPARQYDHLIRDPNVIRQNHWGLIWSGIEPLVVSPYGYFWAFHSNRPAGANSNPTQFSDAVLDTLIDQASVQVDPQAARSAWAAVNERLLNLAVVMPVAHSLDFRITSAQTTNVYPLESVGQYDLAALGVR